MPQQTISIQIDIPAPVHQVLKNYIRNLKGPPRMDSTTGDTAIEPLFRSVQEYVAEILKVNIAKVITEEPTAQIRQLRDEIAERERQIEDLVRPSVTASTAERA
jgi:hypothetical protein